MDFTIIIATCGRPERLRSALGAVENALRTAAGSHRVIVVDNAPTHAAGSIVREIGAASGAVVTYLESTPRNKAHALNAGIRAADTEWLAFTDDDTLPDAQWVASAATFAEASRCRVFGGRIAPGAPEQPLPRWLVPGRSGRVPQMGVFVEYAPRPDSGALEPSMPVPFGANVFAMRRVFEEYGGYDEDLWRLSGRVPLGSEDSEFGIRVRERGERIGYCHEALVVHPVHHERCTLRSHLRLAYYYGWREPMIFFRADRPLFEKYYLRLVGSRAAGMVADFCRRDPAGAADHLINSVRAIGHMVGRWTPAYRERARAVANKTAGTRI
jgi:GT2 family glycosyltransferase